MEKLKEYFLSRFPGLIKRKPGVKIRLWPGRVLFLLVFVAVLGSIFLTGAYGDTIKQRQIEKQKNIGNQELNQLAFDYKELYGIDGKIITDYYWITVLPGFEGSSSKIFLEKSKIFRQKNQRFFVRKFQGKISDFSSNLRSLGQRAPPGALSAYGNKLGPDLGPN